MEDFHRQTIRLLLLPLSKTIFSQDESYLDSASRYQMQKQFFKESCIYARRTKRNLSISIDMRLHECIFSKKEETRMIKKTAQKILEIKHLKLDLLPVG